MLLGKLCMAVHSASEAKKITITTWAPKDHYDSDPSGLYNDLRMVN